MNNPLVAILRLQFLVAAAVIVLSPVNANEEKGGNARATAAKVGVATMGELRQKAREVKLLRASVAAAEESEKQLASSPAGGRRDSSRPSITPEVRIERSELTRQRQRLAELTKEIRAALFPDNTEALRALQAELARATSDAERVALIEEYEAVQASLAREEADAVDSLINNS